MSQYKETLETLIGRVHSQASSVDPTLIEAFLNERMRTTLDKRPWWSGTLARGVVSVPASYNTGTITITNGSTAVTGTDTAWPINDVVNTTVAVAVSEAIEQWVTPASMTGITEDSLLYIDAAGTPEIVAVAQVTATRFRAKFLYAHTAGFTVTASSLAGRQLRLDSGDPVFTVRAVSSATALTIDNPWGDTTETDRSYTILKAYYTLATDMREILCLWDPEQGCSLQFHISQDQLNVSDPQRSATGEPLCLADLTPNEQGNMQYELYPHQTGARQLPYLYSRQWPDMVSPSDRPPPFVNPNLLVWGALSDALRMKGPDYDPKTADHYELRYQAGFLDAVNADNSKALQAWQQNWMAIAGPYGGANYRQNHDWSDLHDWYD